MSSFRFSWEKPEPPRYNEDGTLELPWQKRMKDCRKEGHVKEFIKCNKIEVDELSDDPDEFVEKFKSIADKTRFNRRMQVRLEPVPLDHPQPEGYTRFVVISDTHSKHREMTHPLPPGDVLLHCGDFSHRGKLDEVKDFNDWLGEQNFKEKIVICGNHELSFDPNIVARARKSKVEKNYYRFEFVADIEEEITNDWTKVLTNCTLLHDSEVSYNGIRIYGAPWNPYFGGWAFNTQRGEALLEKWNKIPGDGIDILMTHCPPAGHLDVVQTVHRGDYGEKDRIHKERVGCVELMNTVQLRVMPKYHVYGHIHEDYGYRTDGWHQFINCSIVDNDYNATRKPMIIDMKTPVDGKCGLSEVTKY